MLLSWYLLFLLWSPKITIYILDMKVEGIKKCAPEMYQWVFSTQNEEWRKLVFKTKGKKFREKNCIKVEKRTYLCLFIDPCIKMLAIILHLFKTILNIRFYLNPRRSTVILDLSCLRQIFDSSRWIFDKPVGSDELVPDCRIPYSRVHFAESHIADFC